MLNLLQFRNKAKSLPDKLHFAYGADDGVVANKNGSLMASWYYRGEDLASCTYAELSSISARLNSALRMLGSGWMMHCDLMRRFTTGYPTRGAFPDRTTLIIDQERRQLYEAEGTHLESVYAVTLTYMPDREFTQKVGNFLMEGPAGASKAADLTDRVVQQFNKQIEDFEGAISGLFPVRRMKGVPGTDEFGFDYTEDEQLQYYDYCISGELRPVRLPSVPMYLDAIIGRYDYVPGLVPRVDGRHIKVVAIDGFPQDSYPGILNDLDELGCEYRWSTRFIFRDAHEAKKELEKHRKRWEQKQRGLKDQVFNTSKGVVDLDAIEMTADVQQAMGEAESSLVRYGYYTSVVVLIGNDIHTLNANVKAVQKAIKGKGFGARVEDVNADDAYFGSIPGNGHANVRMPMLHTLNLADLMPITSVWAGSEFNPNPLFPPKSPPLCHTTTTGSTPFRLSLHVEDVGHTLLMGPTGKGKTTALNTLIAQHFRYPNARVFGLDYKNGSLVLCEAAGGDYYDIGGPGQDDMSFCPLGDIGKSTADLTWAAEWLEACAELQGVEMKPAKRSMLFEALQRFKNKASKSMTEFVSEVQDVELKEALAQYTMSGPLGMLLDGAEDRFKYSRFMMFEMEHLLEMGDKNAVPVLMFLFRKGEQQFDGRSPVMVPCDEVWRAAKHPTAQKWLAKSMKTWRSKLGQLVLSTQEPADLLNGPLRDVVLASCPTRILLSNADAIGSQKDLYMMMGLNEAELQIVASLTSKREYYYRSPLGRRRFSFGLGRVALAFVGASGKEEVSLARQAIETHGERWPAEWLRTHGAAEWADYWLNVQ